MNEPKTIKIDEVEYVRSDSINNEMAQELNGLPFVLIRSYGAGVFAGYLEKEDDANDIVYLKKAIRLHYWDGANSISQLAMEGVKNPLECRFSVETETHKIHQVIENIPCTEKARINIQGVEKWAY